jgi:hypothetical protein
MAISAERASIGCIVPPSKLLREFCSCHSRCCEASAISELVSFTYGTGGLAGVLIGTNIGAGQCGTALITVLLWCVVDVTFVGRHCYEY